MEILSIENLKSKNWAMLRASCLIAGTTIGAGMLGIPLVTSPAGFFVAAFSTLFVCIVLYYSGLFYAESTLLMPENSNLLTISERFLGRGGKWIAGGMFLFLYYALLLAYTSGIGAILSQSSFLSSVNAVNSFWCLAIVGVILYAGVSLVDRINFLLSIGLVVSFLLLLQGSAANMTEERLFVSNPSYFFYSIPVLFSAFGYHNIIPSVVDHLNRDKKSIKKALLLGSCFALAIYVLWQMVILGSVSKEQIAQSSKAGTPVYHLISEGRTWIPIIANVFSMFAIVTSLLGVALSMIDFLSDGWRVSKKGAGRIFLTLITLVPPYLLAITYPNIFEKALAYAGGFGESFLNCLLPALCVYVARYKMGLNHQMMHKSGKGMLISLIAIGLLVMLLEGYYAFF